MNNLTSLRHLVQNDSWLEKTDLSEFVLWGSGVCFVLTHTTLKCWCCKTYGEVIDWVHFLTFCSKGDNFCNLFTRICTKAFWKRITKGSRWLIQIGKIFVLFCLFSTIKMCYRCMWKYPCCGSYNDYLQHIHYWRSDFQLCWFKAL